jgi:hypothetical protein
VKQTRLAAPSSLSASREVKYSNIVLTVYANVHSYFCFAANRDGNHKEKKIHRLTYRFPIDF